MVSDSAPIVAVERTCRRPALSARPGGQLRHRTRTSWCCSTSGRSWRGRARCMQTSPGWGSRARACPTSRPPRLPPSRERRDAAIETGPAGRRRRRRPPRLAGGSGRPHGAAAGGVRRPHPAPDRAQPRRGGAWQRRPHGRLRDARRSPAAPGQRLHDRAGPLLRAVRRADRDQHGVRQRVGHGDRARARQQSSRCSKARPFAGKARRTPIADREGGRGGCARRKVSAMSTRKTTLFYALLIAVASLAVGMVIASRLDLSPESSAQTLAVPAANQAPLTGAITLSTFRDIAKAQTPTVVNIRTESRQRAQEMTEFFGGRRRPLPPLLRGAGRRDAPATAAPPARPGGAGRRHRLHHQQGRLHPHQQPRRRGRDEGAGVALRRGRRAGVPGAGRRPRSADRQRAASS